MTTSQTLCLTKDMTIYNALDQKHELLDALIGSDDIELDLSQVGKIDTAGLQLLILLKKEALRAGKRVIIVGIRKDLGVKYVFPEPTHGPGRENPFVSIREALDGLPEWPEGEFCADPFHWYYLSRNRRRDWSEISKTIVSHMRHMPLHPVSPALKRIHTDKWEFEAEGRARRFSYREAARLQGFSKKYTCHGSDFVFPDADHPSPAIVYNQMRQRYKVVGNAVPPPLFEAVARALPDVWD